MQLVSLNAYGGNLSSGERGLASVPGREAEFRDSLDVASAMLQAMGCPALHVLYGLRDGSDPARQDELAAEHLTLAAGAVPVVLVEALSRVDRYPLRTSADVVRVLDRVGLPDVRMLCDVHHLADNGEDPVEVIRRHAHRIGHVQVADVPDRHQPGTGSLDLAGCLGALEEVGYAGWVGLEYVPLGPSADSFAWLRS